MTFANAKPLFEIFALFIAGGWAIYGFIILRQREKVSAEIRKLNLEAKKSEIDLKQIAVIKSEISVDSMYSSQYSGFILFIDVFLSNEGKRNTRLKWKGEDPAITIYPVNFDEDNIPIFSDNTISLSVRKTKKPSENATSHIIRTGESLRISFTSRLSHSGVYLISFRAVMDPGDVTTSIEAGANPNNTMVWTASKFIIVSNQI